MNNIEDSMDNLCRTCMKLCFDKKQSMREIPAGCQNSLSIIELLQVVHPQISIDIEDGLPMQICSDCVHKLMVSHEFIEMYKEVNKQFRKMLKEDESVNCDYDFNELEETLDIIEEDCHAEETKFEFEIEQINIESLAKEEENSYDVPYSEHEPLHELSEETENKLLFLFDNPYSDASDNELTPGQIWHKIYSTNENLEHELNDGKAKSTSIKIPKKNICKNRKENKAFPLPVKNDDGSIPCQECGSIFDNIELWKEHMQQHHIVNIPKRKYTKKSIAPTENESNQESIKCEHCGKGFFKVSQYKSHMRAHTRNMKRNEHSFLCIECGKSFSNVGGLNTHMLRHRGEKTFQCEHCPKKFVCSSGLYGHMMVHTKEKPYVCDICGSAFHMAYQLRKHNLYHNGIKNFKCDYCDMRFVTAEKTRRHMRTHTGEKPYRCKYCERAFAQSNDLIKHLRHHLGDNVYQCDLCPLRFPLARDLRVHFASHKNDDEETRARHLEDRNEAERNLQIKVIPKDFE